MSLIHTVFKDMVRHDYSMAKSIEEERKIQLPSNWITIDVEDYELAREKFVNEEREYEHCVHIQTPEKWLHLAFPKSGYSGRSVKFLDEVLQNLGVRVSFELLEDLPSFIITKEPQLEMIVPTDTEDEPDTYRLIQSQFDGRFVPVLPFEADLEMEVVLSLLKLGEKARDTVEHVLWKEFVEKRVALRSKGE